MSIDLVPWSEGNKGDHWPDERWWNKSQRGRRWWWGNNWHIGHGKAKRKRKSRHLSLSLCLTGHAPFDMNRLADNSHLVSAEQRWQGELGDQQTDVNVNIFDLIGMGMGKVCLARAIELLLFFPLLHHFNCPFATRLSPSVLHIRDASSLSSALSITSPSFVHSHSTRGIWPLARTLDGEQLCAEHHCSSDRMAIARSMSWREIPRRSNVLTLEPAASDIDFGSGAQLISHLQSIAESFELIRKKSEGITLKVNDSDGGETSWPKRCGGWERFSPRSTSTMNRSEWTNKDDISIHWRLTIEVQHPGENSSPWKSPFPTRMASIVDVSSSVEWTNLFPNRRRRRIERHEDDRSVLWSISMSTMWRSWDTDTSFISECSSSCRGEEEGHSKSSSSREKLFLIFIFIFNQANGNDQTEDEKSPWNHRSFRPIKWWTKDEEQTQISLISVLQFSQRREIHRDMSSLIQWDPEKSLRSGLVGWSSRNGRRTQDESEQKSTSSRHRGSLRGKDRGKCPAGGGGRFGYKKLQGAKPSLRRLRVFFSGRLALTWRTDGQTSNHLIGKRIERGMRSLARSIWSSILPSIRQISPANGQSRWERQSLLFSSLLYSERSPRRWSDPTTNKLFDHFCRTWMEVEAKSVHPLLVILITIEDIFLIICEQRESRWGFSSQRQRGLDRDRSVTVAHSTSTMTVDLVDTSTPHWEKREGISRVKPLFHWSSLTSFQRWEHSSGSVESLVDPIGIVRSPKLSISLLVLVRFSSLDVQRRRSGFVLCKNFPDEDHTSGRMDGHRQDFTSILSSLVLWSNFHCSPICSIVQYQWRTTEIALWQQSEEREGRRVIWLAKGETDFNVLPSLDHHPTLNLCPSITGLDQERVGSNG